MTSQTKILNAVEKGMLKAPQKYLYAAGTFFNNYDEYYLRGIIFDELLKETGKDTLTVETQYTELAEGVKKTPWGHTIKENPNGTRCDIAYWDNKKNEVIAFIEIKKSAWNYQYDIEKLYKAIKGKEATGVFGGLLKQVYITGGRGNRQKAKNSLNEETVELKSEVQEYIKRLDDKFMAELHNQEGSFLSLVTPYQEKTDVKESWLYRPVCFVVKPK